LAYYVSFFHHRQTEVDSFYATICRGITSEQTVHVIPKFLTLLDYVFQAKNLLRSGFSMAEATFDTYQQYLKLDNLLIKMKDCCG